MPLKPPPQQKATNQVNNTPSLCRKEGCVSCSLLFLDIKYCKKPFSFASPSETYRLMKTVSSAGNRDIQAILILPGMLQCKSCGRNTLLDSKNLMWSERLLQVGFA